MGKKKNYTWPSGFVSEILDLLDRIEIQEDAALASQRFAIAEKYGITVKINGVASGSFH